MTMMLKLSVCGGDGSAHISTSLFSRAELESLGLFRTDYGQSPSDKNRSWDSYNLMVSLRLRMNAVKESAAAGFVRPRVCGGIC